LDNKTALALASFLVAIAIADIWVFEWGLVTYVGKLVASISEWLAIWR
jgi:hypothetical protein